MTHRFSDVELQEFYQEFREHAADVDRKYEVLCDEIRKNSAVTREIAQANRGNAEAIKAMAQSTADLLAAWQAAQGALSVLAWIGRAAKWVATIGGAGAVLVAAWHYLMNGGKP